MSSYCVAFKGRAAQQAEIRGKVGSSSGRTFSRQELSKISPGCCTCSKFHTYGGAQGRRATSRASHREVQAGGGAGGGDLQGPSLGMGMQTKCRSKGLLINCAIRCLFIGIPLFAGPSARWGWECKERQNTVRSTVVGDHVGWSPVRRLSPEAGGRWVLGWARGKGWQGFHLGFRILGFTQKGRRWGGASHRMGRESWGLPTWTELSVTQDQRGKDSWGQTLEGLDPRQGAQQTAMKSNTQEVRYSGFSKGFLWAGNKLLKPRGQHK